MVTSWDDFPVHQTSEYIAHPATSDRNFYDRYYFNLHPSSDEYFAIFGLGQYPNLGVKDGFVDVRLGDEQHIVRASAPLRDRMNTTVGPLRVEVLEPLKRLRFVVEPTEHTVAMDVTWDGSGPVVEEPRQYVRNQGRLVFDTQRIAQMGCWSGTLRVAGRDIAVTPDHCWGSRDRSWGVRPVGEPEADGIRKGINALAGMWNYFPMQFADHSIYYICHERNDGSRLLMQAERVWPDGRIEELGEPRHEHEFVPGTRVLRRSTITFPDADIQVDCTSLLVNFLSMGTGYGMDADWRHGMYQGPDPVVQGKVLKVPEIMGLAQYGVVDHVGRFAYDGHVGYGLYEHGFFGPFERYGMTDGAMGAP
ncbi:MAG TPA: hypothetical protein VGQ20_03470 [Acidimicrobiales bacterium]|jgi:hypothetical protein|nr:hypothetical protein [Acidimicrobiales bacterium]